MKSLKDLLGRPHVSRSRSKSPQPQQPQGTKHANPPSMRERRSKLVVAHFMVGNTFPYTLEDWVEDIQLAHENAIDGFALNVGHEHWQRDRVADAYQAALQVGSHFKLFISLDMNALHGTKASHINALSSYVSTYRGHPNQLYHDGKVFVSTFGGDRCLFGRDSMDEGWCYVKAALEQVHFVPAFFQDPRCYPDLACLDGIFHWNGGWPIHLQPGTPRDEVECPRIDTDHHHFHHLAGRTYMAAVSPWFFTHYGKDSWNKNWIYRGDDWLLARRWEHLISIRDKVDIVQVISWNDYGESHYIGPIKGAQPNSQDWVDGFPHDAWLHLNAYYARAFKEGQYPNIDVDRIYLWTRPHLKHAQATEDSVPRPENWQLTDDCIWCVVFTRKLSTVEYTASHTHPIPAEPEECEYIRKQVGSGIHKLSFPMIAEGGFRVKIMRLDVIVAEYDSANHDFFIQRRPVVHNFNAFTTIVSG